MKNKNIIYIVVFIFILLLTGCKKEHVHDYSIEWEWGEDVFAIFTCDCGPESTQKILAIMKEEVITEADCLNEGKVIVTAKAMFNNVLHEKTEIIIIPKKEHDLVSHESKAATCTEKGWEAYEECTRCGYTTYKEISVSHEIIKTVVEPGFSTEGYTVDSCSNCDYSFKYSYTPSILKFELQETYYVVSGVNANEISNIVIPETYNGLPVKKIGISAFNKCTSLKNITIPDSVTTIETGAFSNCTSLTNIMIPDSVTRIDAWAFSYCTNLTSINVSENNSYYKSIDGNLYSKDGETFIRYAIGKKVTDFYIPDGVTSIKSYAFEHCTSLTNITIPDSVTTIDYDAFRDCTSLTNIMIPDSVTSIGGRAFSYCPNLTSINVSENNSYYKSIDGNLYSKDGKTLIQYAVGKKVTDFYIPDSVTSIEFDAFNGCTSLTNITIPDSVTTIDYAAFRDCTSLTNIMIPDSVTNIGDYAFSYCTNLTSINVSENNSFYKSIDGNLYSKDGKTLIQYAVGKKVTDFYIPDSVTTIDYAAFRDCISLTNIMIPDSVTNIDYAAFRDCISLTNIMIPDSVTNIGDYAFNGCTSLTSINVSENNSYYKSIDGNLYSKDGKTLIQYAVGKKVTDFYIPDSVTSIKSYAFENCTSLTNITIPDSVTTIDYAAFNGCTSLTSIIIPDSVTSIGSDAFYNCSSLTSIIIPDSVTSIGNFAFSYCSNLTIYCESTSKPLGWDSRWNVTNCPVVWGYE